MIPPCVPVEIVVFADSAAAKPQRNEAYDDHDANENYEFIYDVHY